MAAMLLGEQAEKPSEMRYLRALMKAERSTDDVVEPSDDCGGVCGVGG